MLRIKDGIVDRLRALKRERPSIDRQNPDVRVFGYLDERTVTLYLDLSGEALFKRGWRADKGEAPLKETSLPACWCSAGHRRFRLTRSVAAAPSSSSRLHRIQPGAGPKSGLCLRATGDFERGVAASTAARSRCDR
jgi:hypothetical protein